MKEIPKSIATIPGGVSILKNLEHLLGLYLAKRKIINRADARERPAKTLDLNVVYKELVEGIVSTQRNNADFIQGVFDYFDTHYLKDYRDIVAPALRDMLEGDSVKDISWRLSAAAP